MPPSRAKNGHPRRSRIAVLTGITMHVLARTMESTVTKRNEVSLYIVFNVKTTYILFVDGCDFLEL